jgi:hypothetical protein
MQCLPLLCSGPWVSPSSRSVHGRVSEFRDAQLRKTTKPRANVIPCYAPILASAVRSLFALNGVAKPFERKP